MRPVKVLISAILVLAAPALAQQSVWKWRDADGVVHYSDQPVPGAERVLLSTRDSTSAPVTAQASTSNEPAAAPVYKNLEIWKPFPEAAVNGTQVSVGIRVEPGLAPGHSLWLYLDGRRVDSNTPNATEYELKELTGGKHSVTALIADAKGQRVLTSQSVAFFIQP